MVEPRHISVPLLDSFSIIITPIGGLAEKVKLSGLRVLLMYDIPLVYDTPDATVELLNVFDSTWEIEGGRLLLRKDIISSNFFNETFLSNLVANKKWL